MYHTTEYLGLFIRGENDEPVAIGKQVERSDEIPEGYFTLTVAVFVMNSQGQILMTLRAPEKEAWPNYWENSGGASKAGESSREAIRRELCEETGIDAAEDEFVLIAHRWFEKSALDVYLLHCDIPLEAIRLQKGETADARWCTVPEYEKVIADGLMAGPIAERYLDLRETILDFLNRWHDPQSQAHIR